MLGLAVVLPAPQVGEQLKEDPHLAERGARGEQAPEGVRGEGGARERGRVQRRAEEQLLSGPGEQEDAADAFVNLLGVEREAVAAEEAGQGAVVVRLVADLAHERADATARGGERQRSGYQRTPDATFPGDENDPLVEQRIQGHSAPGGEATIVTVIS